MLSPKIYSNTSIITLGATIYQTPEQEIETKFVILKFKTFLRARNN